MAVAWEFLYTLSDRRRACVPQYQPFAAL